MLSNYLLTFGAFLSFSTCVAQEINFNSFRFFSDSSRINPYSKGYAKNGLNFLLGGQNNKISLESLNFSTKKSSVLYTKSSSPGNVIIDHHGLADNRFWFIEKNLSDSTLSPMLYIISANEGMINVGIDSIALKTFNLGVYNCMSVQNDSTFLHTIDFSFSGDSIGHYSSFYIDTNTKSISKDKEVSFRLLEDNGKIQRAAVAAQNNTKWLIVLYDMLDGSFELLNIDLVKREFTNKLVPFNILDESFSTVDFLGDGIFTSSGFINSQLYTHPTISNKFKLLLTGCNLENEQWIYSNASNRRRIDSLDNTLSNIYIGPFTQLPNGDYLATAQSFKNYNEYVSERKGWQRLLVKVFSNENEPRLKAAYFYELPNGFFPSSINIRPDSTILICGNSVNADNIFYPTYLNIGNGSTVGINQPNKPNERLKFSLNDSQSLLRIHHQDLQNLEIFDEWGRQVAQSNEQSIDIAHLAQGLYIVRTKTQNGQSRQANFIKSL